jgi:uncharacterized protein YxjI
MDIEIHQEKISLGDRYAVFSGGVQTHSAAARFPRIRAVIDLARFDSGEGLLTIQRRFAFFKAQYDISFPDGTFAFFETLSYWQKHFQCTRGETIFDIYGHRGRRFSVFKNGVQVGWWERNSITWFKGDSYKLVADKSNDNALIIAFCLIIDNYSNSDRSRNMVTINFGSLMPGAKSFDPGWQPSE